MNCPYCNKQIDSKIIGKALGSKGGQANKKGKRPDLKKGGATWEKRWGKKKKKEIADV